jgi:superfamily II DNA or RNA helicase
MARPVPPLRTHTNRFGLREWQHRAMAAMAAWREGPFLLSAAPGAGKARPALEFAREQLASGAVNAVVVACPTAPLTRQWARAADGIGLDLAPDTDTPRPPSGFHGVSVTYARIAKAPMRWARALPRRSLIIADEAHHLGEDLSWGVGFTKAFGSEARWLLLSGTPFRSDATPIPGVSYDSEGLAEPDVTYNYAEAVADRICRPVCFVAYDGTLSWRSGDDVIESSFETVLSTREASRRYRTAISTELPDGLPRILHEADKKLRAIRQQGHRDAGGLVIAADSEHARRIAKLLREVTGRVPLVVLHAEPRAAAKLAAFRHSTGPWIVAMNMVSEGVDIPRLRVGVYATAAKTPLIFRQIVGRFVRTVPGATVEPSWLYVPADPVLRDHASTIEQEVRRALRAPSDPNEEQELERAARRETERGPAPEFVPLSADVVPQLSLFGAPAARSIPAAAAHWTRLAPAPAAKPSPGSGGSTEAPEREMPAFERRAMLREERHRLVSEVRRRDGTSHREINAWLNRKLGIVSVEQATLAELERSINLLVGKLSAQR